MTTDIFKLLKSVKSAEKLRLTGQSAAAKDILESVVNLAPGYYAAQHSLGLVKIDLLDYDGAIAALTKAVTIFENGFMSHTALATIYSELGLTDAAATAASTALKINPNLLPARVTLAQILRDQKKYHEAYSVLECVSDQFSSYFEAGFLFAVICGDLGKTETAVATYRNLLRERAVNPKLLYAISQSRPIQPKLLSVEKILEALHGLEEAERRTPEWKLSVATCLERCHNFDSAWKLICEAKSELAVGLTEKIGRQSQWQQESLGRTYSKCDWNFAADSDEFPKTLFILGPSRSGKSTAEATLQMCNGVSLGYESPLQMDALKSPMASSGLPPIFQYDLLPNALDSEVRTEYLRLIRSSFSEADIVTFTSPMRIHDAARIAEIIPNCYFIFIDRSAIDTALRIFQKNYSSGNYYSLEYRTSVEHVEWYYSMVNRLTQLRPDRCATVKYLDLNNQPSPLVRVLEKFFPSRAWGDEQMVLPQSLDESPSDYWPPSR